MAVEENKTSNNDTAKNVTSCVLDPELETALELSRRSFMGGLSSSYFLEALAWLMFVLILR